MTGIQTVGRGYGWGREVAKAHFEDRDTEFSNMDCKRNREDRNNNKTVITKHGAMFDSKSHG